MRLCHIIDNLDLGGAQIMMLELISSINQQCPYINNQILSFEQFTQSKYQSLYNSYNLVPKYINKRSFSDYVSRFDILIQHRTKSSQNLKPFLPKKVKYVLINHTYSNLTAMTNFKACDYYISVCDFLHKKTKWASLDETRRSVILNGLRKGVPFMFNASKPQKPLTTGRCHRLSPDKFKMDSLIWMDDIVLKQIPGHKHYLIGHNFQAKQYCKTSPSCVYLGEIKRRDEKFKNFLFDVFFYETFAPEGASIAILEALSCGIPVLCNNWGGNSELVINGVNGFIETNRNGFLERLKELSCSDNLQKLQESTIVDFTSRLEISSVVDKYIQVFNLLV